MKNKLAIDMGVTVSRLEPQHPDRVKTGAIYLASFSDLTAYGATIQIALRNLCNQIDMRCAEEDKERATKKKAPAETKRVIVNDQYTYETNLDVKIGDMVMLPGGQGDVRTWTGTVTALTSSYAGECKAIIGVDRKSQS